MTAISNRVMRRVYLIWLTRRLVGAALPRLAALAVFGWLLSNQVAIDQVWRNAPAGGDWLNWYRFFSSSFVHTELTVQLLLIISGLTAWWLGQDLWRRFTPEWRWAGRGTP